MESVQFESGEYGRRAVIRSAWSPEMTKYLLANGVLELELNDGKGWRGTDLSFLGELPHLQSLKVLALNTSSEGPLHRLGGLRELTLSTYCQSAIDFSAFPQLEKCSLEWRPKAASLFDCTTLKSLFINRYKGKDTMPLAKLVHLESLSILNAPVASLNGLSALKEIRYLRLAALRRLASLAGLESLKTLEKLDVNTCPAIRSIEEIGSLRQLKEFCLNNCGEIASLKPLNSLNGLERMTFYESTNILDGDLSPLIRQKHLTRVAFRERKHYSHRREGFALASAII